MPLKAKPGLAIGEIDAKSVIPEDTEESAKSKTTIPKILKETTAVEPETEGRLDDVSLE